MRTKLLLLFVIVPLIEIMLFIEIGSRIGTWMTLLIVAGTAVVGASLAHQEGLKTWWRIQDKLSSGILPDTELLDALLILMAGITLITPGFLTDAIGFLLLYPGTRRAIQRWLRRQLSQRLQVHDREW
jgi:UPF0716 protein FxsA